MTITEALAEIKTLVKRIESKRGYVNMYMVRLESLKDPLEKDGGSTKVIEQELQAIKDLEDRLVSLRAGISFTNEITYVEIEGVSKSIAQWLIWRREVAPLRQKWIMQLRLKLDNARNQLRNQPVYVNKSSEEKPQDMVVSIDEGALAKEAEQLQNILGQLDGQLSLKNATVEIKV